MLLTAPALNLPAPAFAASEAPQSGDLADSAASLPPVAQAPEIIVQGVREDGLIEGILPRDELTEADVEAMGLDSVGDILEELGVNLGAGGEGPVILINGELSSSSADISDLPPEALRRIQLLPPKAAVAYGAPRRRPVINVVLKRNFRQATALAESRVTTLGGGNSANGEARWTSIRKGDRDNISIRFDGAQPLLESDRNIITERDGLPLSLRGIVLPFPLFGSEIDPVLSALVGRTISEADVPSGKDRPSLADFVTTAGLSTPDDLGEFRTLRPRTRRAVLNATFARRISQRTNLQFYVRGDYSASRSLNGMTSAFLSLPATNPVSPFSGTVTVGRYLGEPLEQAARGGNFDIGGTLTRRAGAWQLSLNAKWVHGETTTRTDRGLDLAGLQTAIDSGAFNPFAALPADLARMTTDPGKRRRDQNLLQLNVSGPLFALPAGAVTANLSASGTRERSLTRSSLRGLVTDRHLARDEGNVRGGLVIPILADSDDARLPLGNLSVTLSASARSISNVGTFRGYGYGIDWQPFEALRLEAGFDRVQAPPSQQMLTDPVVVRENVRIFDFVRNETAEVRFLTGGNPGLPTEQRDSWTLGARLRTSRALELTAEWSREQIHDAQGSLPPPNAEVQSAFSDRYRRDGSGRLFEVDGRAVSFARVQRDEFRWGFTLRKQIGGGGGAAAPAAANADDDTDEAPSVASRNALRKGVGGVRIMASAQHAWTLKAARQARAGLPQVDLLAGGAAGYGGGLPRHRVEFRTGAAAGGFGLQLTGSWTGSSQIRAGSTPQPGDLRFSAVTSLDLRAFADLGRVFPHAPVLKGTRLTVGADNLLNQQVVVRDRSGATPLSYQRYLIDPLGRTINIGLRKKF
ncbi:MAG: hypothetical protein NTX28_15185 [Novosphingobium sp.]|nr:hypothetical protein [Novosphingobium sp.]